MFCVRTCWLLLRSNLILILKETFFRILQSGRRRFCRRECEIHQGGIREKGEFHLLFIKTKQILRENCFYINLQLYQESKEGSQLCGCKVNYSFTDLFTRWMNEYALCWCCCLFERSNVHTECYHWYLSNIHLDLGSKKM